MPETETKQSIASMFKRPLLAGALATAAAASIAMPVPALAETFLRLDGIEGESTDEKHKNEIAILSFTQSWINSTTISGSGAGKGRVQCGAITLMKTIDRSSPVLVKKTIQGVHIPTGQLTFRSEGGMQAEYYTIKLSEILITEVTQTDTADPARIIEKVVLNARRFEYEYKPQDETGGTGGIVKAGYDCSTTSVT
jgi:type VI secretion system secreted protein Hcp